MKTKKFMKRLALNKKTIANLNSNQMKSVIGGESGDPPSCPTHPNCGTSWDVCDPTICATVCNWTQQALCTLGCPPE